MQPGANGVPTPQMEKITTQGVTTDSRRLDVFVHALPSVRPVSWGQPGAGSSGTAFVVSQDGLMVTNKHVVDGSNGTLQVKMLKADGTEDLRSAHVVKVDGSQDLALLQLDRNPSETFQALPLSQVTSWRGNEPLVEMGNANGQGTISMAKASFGSLINQNNIPFLQQPPNVFQGRTMYELNSTVPRGYSGGVVLSVPGSDRDTDGNVIRQGTFAVRAVTDYSDRLHKAWVIPAARVQSLVDQYRREQAGTNK
jgi:S1-C subfamily serine protease